MGNTTMGPMLGKPEEWERVSKAKPQFLESPRRGKINTACEHGV
jgi:hypothetical protein